MDKSASSSQLFDLSLPALTSGQETAWAQLSSAADLPAYVLGRNQYAGSVAEHIKVAAFIDDYTSETSFLGKPVVRMMDVPKNAIVISCVVDARPLTGLKRLQEAGFDDVLDYFILVRLAPERFPIVGHMRGSRNDIVMNLDRYERLHDRLADQESKRTLRKVVQFRATLDVNHLNGFIMRTGEQYFEPFIKLNSGESFVDGGGFDGQTALAFHRLCPDHGVINFFEPSPEMMATARKVLHEVPDVQFFQKGLHHSPARLRFDSGSDSASHLSETGDIEIEVTSIDQAIASPVTFIKLDVEGAEYEALVGARKHILENHPTLAVCVYHRQDDFWRIPELVLSMREDYEIYLRHYTEGVLETVMFFVPRQKT